MDPKTIFSTKNKQSWEALGNIWNVIGTSDGWSIVTSVLKEEGINTSVLQKRAGVPTGRFFPKLRLLVDYGMLQRKVDQNRNVSYNVSKLGEQVLEAGDKVIEELLRTQADV